MGPLPGQSAGALQVILALPQLAADGAVEEDQAQHGAEEVGGGHPQHDVQLARGDGVAGVLTLARAEIRVRLVVVLDSHQEERRGGAGQGEGPQRQDDVLHAAARHHHLAAQREANGQVALNAERRDVQDGGRRAALEHVVVEAAHGLAEQPRHVLPQAVEVEGQADEEHQVGHGHAGQVEVGGGLHVLEVLDDEDGHCVARHAHHEDEDADDGDGDEGGRREDGALVVVVVHGVRLPGLRSVHVRLHLGSGPGHHNLHFGPKKVTSGSARTPGHRSAAFFLCNISYH